MYLECQKLLAINMSTLKALYKHIVFLLGKDYITSGKKNYFCILYNRILSYTRDCWVGCWFAISKYGFVKTIAILSFG
jgi:hypothetical protein